VHEKHAAEWIEGRLRAFGIEQVAHQRVPLPPTWTLHELGLELLEGGAPNAPAALASATAGWGSPSTPPEGLVAPLVYVGLGTPADLRGRDLQGKIALVHGRALGGVHITTGEAALSRIVRAGGAVGVIVMVDQPGNARTLTRNGRDGPAIPNMTVGLLDGTYLRKSIEHAPPDSPPRLRMRIRAEWKEGLHTSAVSAVLPGTHDEFLLFQAHLDGFWQAATDNGGGVASVLGLARHYAAQAPERRRRGLVFLLSGGHEDGSAGALHFGRSHRELLRRTTLVIELEHVASTLVGHSMGGHYERASSEAPVGIFVTNQSPIVLRAYRSAAERYSIAVNQSHYPYYWGDIIGLMPTGVAASGWIGSNFYYHSSLDSVDAVRPRSLERITRATAFVADTVNRYSRAELEAGAIPYPVPETTGDEPSIHMGDGMTDELRRLLGFGSTLW
jgi:Zn-dependent M28 family amino/carboxypeptidase